MEPALGEAPPVEELHFFKRLGELCFSSASAQAYAGGSSLAVAARAGAVFFSDAQGEGRL